MEKLSSIILIITSLANCIIYFDNDEAFCGWAVACLVSLALLLSNRKADKCKQKAVEDIYNICDYLNSHEIYVRDKRCHTHRFKAHVVHRVNREDDIIIIDLI